MLKKIITISMIFVLTFTIVGGVPSYAKTKSETKEALAESRANEKAAQAEYDAAKKKESNLAAEIEKLEKSIENTEVELKSLETKIAKNNKKIEDTEIALQKMEVTVQRQNDDLSARLRMMYESGDASLIEVLLGSEDINDFVGGIDIVKKIHEYDMQVLDDLNKQLDKVEKKKSELDKMKKQLDSHKEEQIQKRENIASDKKKLAAAKEQAHEDAEEALEDLAAAKKESDALQTELKSYQSSYTYSGGGSGTFAWPVSGPITSGYGYRNRPNYGTWTMHTGIDIGVPSGTPVHAAEDGVVYSAGWKGSYGNCIIVDHGSGIMTLYAHNSSFAVGAGASVKRGQVIAYAGSTGNSTGPHCHFEVRVNGTTQNPLSWLG
jgi:murein DD-endopeptidase MepM/ murein hydrolase activator NlpD